MRKAAAATDHPSRTHKQ